MLGIEVNGELPFKGGIGILDGGPHRSFENITLFNLSSSKIRQQIVSGEKSFSVPIMILYQRPDKARAPSLVLILRGATRRLRGSV